MAIKYKTIIIIILIVVIATLAGLISTNYFYRINSCPTEITNLGNSILLPVTQAYVAPTPPWSTNSQVITFFYNKLDSSITAPFTSNNLQYTLVSASDRLTENINFTVVVTMTNGFTQSINVVLTNANITFDTTSGIPKYVVNPNNIQAAINPVLNAYIPTETSLVNIIPNNNNYKALKVTLTITMVGYANGTKPTGQFNYSCNIINYNSYYKWTMSNNIPYAINLTDSNHKPPPAMTLEYLSPLGPCLDITITIKNNLVIETPSLGILTILAYINYINNSNVNLIPIYSGTNYIYNSSNKIITFLPADTKTMLTKLSPSIVSAALSSPTYNITFAVQYTPPNLDTINLYVGIDCNVLIFSDGEIYNYWP